MGTSEAKNIFDTWTWRWTDLCPTGLTPWMAHSNDLMPCFQQICLQFPIYSLFAIFSAYYFGLHGPAVARNRTQIQLLLLRIMISLVLAFLEPLKIYFDYAHEISVTPTDILLACTKCVTWFIHTGFLFSLQRSGSLSHRGPLFLNVVWTSVLALNVIWFRTSLQFTFWIWGLLSLAGNFFYLITLVPNGDARFSRTNPEDERQSLLGNGYVNFNIHFNEMSLGYAQDEANIPSSILFYWVNPLIIKGMAGNLKKIEDLFDLPDCLNISRISERLSMAISHTSSLFWALHKTVGREFYLIGLLRFIADTAGFAGPLLLGGLLNENTTENAGTDIRPYFYAMGLLAATLLSAFCGTHFNWRMAIVGMKMRIGIVSTIYRKALEARGLQDSRPEILNLMSTDTDRIVNSCVSFHSFWSIPFQLFTTLYLLYVQVGAAFIAGVVFAATLIPINRWLAVRIGQLSQSLMTAKDARLSITSETISGAKQIKLYAWEEIFINKIQNLRKTEVEYLAKRKYLDAICVYFWATTPVLMCLLTFGVSTLMGNPLTASSTYTAVALLNMLIGPLNAFPWVLNGLIEAWVSLKRVQELLDLPNLDFSSYYNPIFGNMNNDDVTKPSVLQFNDCTFEYDNKISKQEADFAFTLKDVTIDVKKGELVCIEGPVGGGKTTLISAIVAGVNCIEGMVCVQDLHSGFGYVSQSPWLQRGTIRENILWGSAFDEIRYKNVIHACGLTEDLEILGGDLIGIGEGGRTLSGGQRARVSLARAVYQDKKIYLMDDILSALDAHVANHVIKYCILGLLKEKTRIIISENRTIFYHSNQILHIENGLVTPSEYAYESLDLSDDEYQGTERSEAFSKVSLKEENDNASVDSIMLEESREYGTLSSNVLAAYWKSMTAPVSIAVLAFVILMQVSRNVSDGWLAYWVNAENPNSNFSDENAYNQNHTNGYYLSIYTTLAVTNSLITLGRSFLFAYGGIKAAKIIHDKLLSRVIYTKFEFFDITSVGRILNRFSSDTYTIDDTLPFILNIFLAQSVGLIGAICVCLYAMPWLGLIIVPMCPIYINLQHQYRHASRDIKRLSSNALSPLYTHFTETLNGLTTIRAMRASPRFQRDFHVKLEESIKAQLTSSAAQQWLALRLQILGAILVGGAGFVAAITSAHATNPGLVGLAISYALSITGLLGGVLNAFAETEQEMIAVERVQQYTELEPEDNTNGSLDPPYGWPTQGSVSFDNVSLKYREHLRPALIDVNLKTSAFERVAIVGRTGAGKSSMLAALLRVAPLSGGSISVDCVNLRNLSLRVLRDRIVIIPQEPFLFEGTLTDNLDPCKQYTDSEKWNAITNCLATPLVQALGGLNGRLERGGSNISAGQRQLLCLTRALLKNSKIVCIDEGTSNLDNDSEAAMQIVLQNCFKSSTVFFIAHRLKGLNLMDRIIVMDNGRIVEHGNPKELASDPKSIFFSMLQEQKNKDYSGNESN